MAVDSTGDREQSPDCLKVAFQDIHVANAGDGRGAPLVEISFQACALKSEVRIVFQELDHVISSSKCRRRRCGEPGSKKWSRK
jgi:hypothetical protein